MSDVLVTGNTRGLDFLPPREVTVSVNALAYAKDGRPGAGITMNVNFIQRLLIPVWLITAKIRGGEIHERPNLGG